MHGSISKGEFDKQLAKGIKTSVKCFFSNMLGEGKLPKILQAQQAIQV